MPGTRSRAHVFDASPLRETLDALVDFGRLSDGPVRLLVTAVDLETGEDVTFDSHAGGIQIEHLLASTAFPVAFTPVTIDGRVYVDPGVSANLPILPLFALGHADEVLCLALDLVTAPGKTPGSLDETVKRLHDLIFASQSRHALELLQGSSIKALSGKTAIVHLSYDGNEEEIGGKSLDYSTQSVRLRWAAGKAATQKVLTQWGNIILADAHPVYRLRGNELTRPD